MDALTNSATPYSKSYAHSAATCGFEPHGHATVKRAAEGITENADHTKFIVPYIIEIQADSNNTWHYRRMPLFVMDFVRHE